ncbi:Teichuronic acid biosynthesis protein TuaB [termite gut metagenome]|uniref:Teichuronic acid biosynthesis protein TuaB n=1 Tax=termite gut metagenome TaxID=433724 RepID=A0A5J4RKG7_9ZZZZ
MNLKEKAISGAKWTSMATVVVVLIQVFRLMILTRFLDKEEFGIVAIITFILGLTYTFSDIGFSVAIMHTKHIDDKEFSSLFWSQFLIFSLIYIALSFSAPWIASFYNEVSISYLMPIALIDLVLSGIGKLYDTVLQKTMQFKKIALRNIISAFCSVLVALILAVHGFGIYSMIISTLSQTLINNLWNFLLGQQQYKIKLFCSISKIKPFFRIGIYQTGTQIIDYFCSKLDILIIGKFFGSEILGVYSLAKELVLKLVLIINSIVNKVALPILSYNNDNNHFLRTQYCKIINFLSLINFPINTFLCIFSYHIVFLLYGQKYSDVAPLVSILSIYGIMLSIGNPVGNITIAKGRTDISFKYVLLRSIISIVLITISSFYSIRIVAWSQVIMMIILFAIAWRMIIYRLIQLPILNYIKSFSGIGLISLAVGIPFFIIVHYNIFYIDNLIFQLIVYGIMLLLSYIILLNFFMKKELLIILKEFIKIKL